VKHKLIVGMDFLNTVRLKLEVVETGEVVINAQKSTPEDKEIRKMCQI